MQVETQMNMKSQATGVRKASDGIDPNHKRNKRLKLEHNLGNSDKQNVSSETADSCENSFHPQNENGIFTTESEENFLNENRENDLLNDSYINGIINNGGGSVSEQNLSNGNGYTTEQILNNGDLESLAITQTVNEDDSNTMDVSESQYLPPPTLELASNEPYEHCSSNTSEASELPLESLKYFDEPCQNTEPCFSQKEQSASEDTNVINAPQVFPSSEREKTVCNELPVIVEPFENGAIPSTSNHEEIVPQQREEIAVTIKKDDVKYLGIYDLKTTQLEGHADVIFSVAADDKVVLSSSGDTTVKVWSVEDKMELHNFAGHTDAVTSVKLLNSSQSKILGEKLSHSDISSVAVSVAMDCHIKVWSVTDAKELSSIYTFNSITTMDCLYSDLSVVLGTEGGKLEVWDLCEGKKIDSVLAHESAVSHIKVQDSHIYSVSVDGAVKVWLFEDGEIQPLYSRKRRETSSAGADMGPTHWKSVAVSGDTLFLGDTTPYLKILDWRLGRMHLLTNQKERTGVCDAILADDNVLLSTSYDSLKDTAGINVWSLPDMVYVGTLSGDVQDIYCLTMAHLENKLRIVSGGHQLIVWDFNLKAPLKNGANDAFSLCEIEGIGVEVNERPMRERIHHIKLSTPEINNNEDRRNSCNIL